MDVSVIFGSEDLCKGWGLAFLPGLDAGKPLDRASVTTMGQEAAEVN